MFWVDIDGYRVAVQAVLRGKTAYWRLAPYTIVYPTPRQRAVRETLSMASHEEAGQDIGTIDRSVRDAFRGWEYSVQAPNKTYLALKQIYGSEADAVLEYIQKQKKVGEILRAPEKRREIDITINRLLKVNA